MKLHELATCHPLVEVESLRKIADDFSRFDGFRWQPIDDDGATVNAKECQQAAEERSLSSTVRSDDSERFTSVGS